MLILYKEDLEFDQTLFPCLFGLPGIQTDSLLYVVVFNVVQLKGQDVFSHFIYCRENQKILL